MYYIGGVLLVQTFNERENTTLWSFTSLGYGINRQGSHLLLTGTLGGSGLILIIVVILIVIAGSEFVRKY